MQIILKVILVFIIMLKFYLIYENVYEAWFWFSSSQSGINCNERQRHQKMPRHYVFTTHLHLNK